MKEALQAVRDRLPGGGAAFLLLVLAAVTVLLDPRRELLTWDDGWAYARRYDSEAERRAALPGWLHFYNHHRTHSAIGGTPASRLNNLPGHHT